MDANKSILDPKLLGFWTRCIRNSSNWSQEALAASANLDVRTIQRVESGHPVSSTTRRNLARGLGYDNSEIFDDPEFVKNVHEILQHVQKSEFESQFPGLMPIKAFPVSTGEDLLRLAEHSNAYMFHSAEQISADTKQWAAGLFDYVRDFGDIVRDISFSERVTYSNELGSLLEEKTFHRVIAYSATRTTRIVGEHWADKTPMSMTIGYLLVVPEGTQIEQMMVSRKVGFGW